VLRSAVRRLRARTAGSPPTGPEQDAGAALLAVVLLMFVVLALATLVLGVVVSQVKPTRATQQSTRLIFAAETGTQTALAQIRTSTGAGGVGSLRELPCRVAGEVPSPAGGLSFSSAITYFTQDPSGKSDTWQTTNALPCTEGAGVPRQPVFALVSTVGQDASAGALVHSRSLLAQYAFRVSNKNIPGGVIFTAPREACLQASSATAGATVIYQPATSCSSSNDLQRWVYDTGYHLVLASTITATTTGGTTGSSGLCITQPALSATDRTVSLQACTLDSRSAMQLWSYESGAHFRGQNASNKDYGKNCLYAGQTSWSAGDTVKAGGSSTCDAANESWGSFSPEPQVGAGAASFQTSQLVNYKEFGRCADVTNMTTSFRYMILYPCKQDPSGGSKLAWNHRWYYGAETGVAAEPDGASGLSTRVRVRFQNDSDRTSCLTSPAPGSEPAYVTFRSCDSTPSQAFTRYYATGSYTSSYTFVASDGRCLSVGEEQSPRNDGVYWSTMVLETCDGGPAQKWNAPPTALEPSVSRQLETSVSG